MDTGLLELIDWWRNLSPRGRMRVATAVVLLGGGVLVGYLLGMRQLRLLTLAYGRSHPAVVTGPMWLMDPLPRIWPYMLAGAAVGALLAVLLKRLTRVLGATPERPDPSR